MMARRRAAEPVTLDEEQDPIPDVAIEEPATAEVPPVGMFVVDVRKDGNDEWRRVALSTETLTNDARDVLRAPWVFRDLQSANDVAAIFQASGFEACVNPFFKD